MNSAHAQSGGVGSASLFTIPPGDKSKSLIIDRLFGSLSGGSGVNDDPLVGLLALFNGAALFLGGIIVAYTLIVGTMVTAHDGEMLGKQWSSLWVPIRTIIGTAFAVPAISGGYCIAQAIVLWAALQGVGLADTLTAKLVDQFSTFKTSVITASPDINDAVGNMFISLTCSEAITKQHSGNLANTNKTLDTATGLPSGPFTKIAGTQISFYPGAPGYVPSPVPGMPSAVPVPAVGYLFYPTVNDPRVGACGSATLNPGNSTFANRKGSAQGGALTSGMSDGANLFDSSQIYSDVFTAQGPALDKLVASLDAAAKELVNGGEASSVAAKVNAATNAWVASSANAASNSASKNQNKALVDAMKSDGWLTLGAWYMSVARAQQDVDSAASVVPQTQGIQVPLEPGEKQHWWNYIGIGAGDSQSMVNATISDDTRASIAAAKKIANETSGMTATDAAVKESGMGARLAKYMTEKITLPDTGASSDASTQNPVVAAQQLGSAMVGGSIAAMGSVFVVDQLMRVSVLGNSGGGISDGFIDLTVMIGMALLVPGLTLAYYIPMVPFFLWIGAVLAWLIMLIEAMVAAPLWMVAHLNPEGQGLMGGAKQGYMLLLGLVLRPALMVIGFAAAVAIMVPMGSLLNSIFFGAFLSGIQPSWLGLVSFIAGLVLYTYILQQIITKVFGLIYEIPEHSMSWIGGGGGRMSQHAESMSSGARGMGQAVATGMAFQGIRGMMKQGADKGRARDDAAAGADSAGAALDEKRAATQAAQQDYAQAQRGVQEASSRYESAVGTHGADSPQAAIARAGMDQANHKSDQALSNLQSAQKAEAGATSDYKNAIGAARRTGANIGSEEQHSAARGVLRAEQGKNQAAQELSSAQGALRSAQGQHSTAVEARQVAESNLSTAQTHEAAARASGNPARIADASATTAARQSDLAAAVNNEGKAAGNVATATNNVAAAQTALGTATKAWESAIGTAKNLGGPAEKAAKKSERNG
jgi:conjugal transfer/type IV secretion protein DotA/TraY